MCENVILIIKAHFHLTTVEREQATLALKMLKIPLEKIKACDKKISRFIWNGTKKTRIKYFTLQLA